MSINVPKVMALGKKLTKRFFFCFGELFYKKATRQIAQFVGIVYLQ